MIIIIIAIIHCCIPIVLGHFDANNAPIESYEIEVYIMLNILNIYYFSYDYAFLIFSYYVYDQHYRHLSQLSNLLSSKKTEKYKTKKYYPTINLYDNISLKSWGKLHDILRNYGEKHKLFIEAYLTILLIFYLSTIILASTLQVLNVMNYSKVSFVVLCFEIIVILILILLILKKGCAINDHFFIHLMLLRKNKDVLLDLLRLSDIYFEKKNFVSENPIYSKGIQLIENAVEEKINKIQIKENINLFKTQYRKEILNSLIRTCNDVIQQIEIDSYNKPFSIMGLQISSGLLKSIIAVLFSLFYAFCQNNLINELKQKLGYI